MLQFEETKSVAGLGIQHSLNAGLGITANFVAAEPAAATVRLVAPSAVTTVQTPIPESLRRIRLEDKRIINGKTDVNQLVPFKYKWAWEKYLAGCANHWMPQEINMSRDIASWKAHNRT